MLHNLLKAAAAAALFAAVHSLLASRPAKRAAARLLGERRRNALYRPLYNLQAIATTGALVVYILRLPDDRELYHARGPVKALLLLGEGAALLYLLDATRQIGIARFLGVPNIVALLRGEPDVPREPEGQGPPLEPDGHLHVAGAFRTSRNASNFALLPVMWLMPHMTVHRAAACAVITLHLVLGSYHEEARLREAYGRPYLDYAESGVPFFLPALV